MRLLFLDIDGVLNGNGIYSYIDNTRCIKLNAVLARYPDLKICLSSSWLSYILEEQLTLEGFETLLRACGLNCFGRLIGHCGENVMRGYQERADAIIQFCKSHFPKKWVAIDDWPLPLPDCNFVQTQDGLLDEHVQELIDKLK